MNTAKSLTAKPNLPALRIALYGTIITLIGILLSGPIGLVIVTLVAKQPDWVDPALWAANYNPIQTIPFFFGFLLVGGYVITISALYHVAEEKHKTHAMVAIIFTAMFATLIFFNYINQTTFLPALAKAYQPAFSPIITAFSFSNPLSLCWSIEMWGYGLLGVATWAAAPLFYGSRIEKITSWLMVANGVISLAGGFISAWDLNWVFTAAGFVNYLAWNLLVTVLAVTMIVSLKRRMA